MMFNTIAITALSIIASATQVNARRRHLNTIKGDESDASMSYMLSPARGSSKSKSATGAPTGSPTGSPTESPTGSPTGAPTSAPTPEPGDCGSVIFNTGNDDGNIFTLQKDILDCDCDAFGYALKVDGQGTVLNLNGHTVECTDADTGAAIIEVIGTANTVMGPGLVKGGRRGLRLKDGGFHTVDGVNIGPDLGQGIGIGSNDNTIINNFITESVFDGVVILGTDRNIIKGNTIVNTGLSGILLDTVFPVGDTSDDNQIVDNTIISASRFGLEVTGNRIVIQGNTINQSGSQGIVLSSFSSTEGAIIKDNSITNSVVGIRIETGTTNTVVIGNTFAGNRIVNLSVSTEAEEPITAGNIPNLP